MLRSQPSSIHVVRDNERARLFLIKMVALVGIFVVILSMVAVMAVMTYMSTTSSSAARSVGKPMKRSLMKRSLLEEVAGTNLESDGSKAAAPAAPIIDASVATPVQVAPAANIAAPAPTAAPIAPPPPPPPQAQFPSINDQADPGNNNNNLGLEESVYVENEMASTTTGSPSYG